MNVYSGADCETRYIHTITGTVATVYDLEEAPKLLRPDDEVVYDDSAKNDGHWVYLKCHDYGVFGASLVAQQ